jgi:hypothetical protein
MKVFWNNPEKTILIREYPESWTWDEFRENVETTRQMFKEVQHDIFFIIDARNIRHLPEGALSYINEAHRNTPRHVVMRFFVTNNKYVERIASMLVRAVPQNFENFYIVNSMEKAEAKIAEYQKS